MKEAYLEKIYSGLLGMNIGIRLGAPVEPTIWSYERIQSTYGDITDYVKDYKNFAADDDANGPFYFLRALYDKPEGAPLTPQDVADAWLNYAREGVGMFWWGGYGTSTEHTAYLNLKAGVPAPQSGSIAQNGKTMAEQIGGQIFIDTWGLVCPNQPDKAAEYGTAAASVSHDGEGVNGAKFFCAAIAAAFEESAPEKLVDIGLSHIPADSTYKAVAEAVKAFYHKNPADWRACMAMLQADWGYDKYPGVCHIIPNAGVCIMSLLYGGGDFARTVEIATMAGWDTDCNAGNVGTVMGVACGLSGLPAKYRAPINDFIALSGVSGYLNIMDVPTYAKEVALLAYALAGENAPEALRQSFKPGEIHFDFELPGSTHGMRISDPFFCRISHSTKHAKTGTGSLEILLDRMVRGDQCRLFYKPFYLRDDFSDERYSPVFTPMAYSGQVMRASLFLDQWNGWETPGVSPYVRTAGGNILQTGYTKLVNEDWIEIEFTLPDTEGDLICEVGLILEGYAISKAKTLGMVYLDDFSITGKAKYSIAMAKQRKNFGCITPFSFDHGARDLENGKLLHMRDGEAFAYAGNYYATDCEVRAQMTPLNGESHLLLARAKGILWGYAAGFAAGGKVAIYKNDHGYAPLAEADFAWECGKAYTLGLRAQGGALTLTVNGAEVLAAKDESFAYGMYGFGSLAMGRTAWGDFEVEEL